MDEAALRRLSRRIYMPLPDAEARWGLIEGSLQKSNIRYEISEAFMVELMQFTEGYSSADL